jgi:phosphohistidine swiveling domain-containing protein
MKYHFHGRASDIPLVMSELIFNTSGYRMFDYYILQEGSLLTGYFSDLGAKEMRKYAEEHLFDPQKRKEVLSGIREYGERLKQFSVPNDYWRTASDTNERLQTFSTIRALAEEFGRQYFVMEQPWLLALEEVVEKACAREGLQHDAVLHDPTLAQNFSELETELLATLVELGHLKLSVHTDSESFMRSIYSLLSYISERENIPIGHAESMTGSDIEEYLRSGSIDREMLKIRSKGVVLLPRSKGEPLEMIDGAGYREWKSILEPPLTGDIKGSVACRGKVQGRVTLHLGWINVTEIPAGNILVTGMTNPQMMPYIKHAAAIITDEGGLACHAAIISREMKIPCIVGTKIATQVLRDGDLVEVDADNGIVTKLS